MMRAASIAVVLIVVALLGARTQEEKQKPLDAGTLAVGQIGEFSRGYRFAAFKILGPNEMIVKSFVVVTSVKVAGKPKSGAKPAVIKTAKEVKGKSFTVRGIPTKDLADGSPVPLKGPFRVSGTLKSGEETYFIIEPAPKDDSRK